MKQFFFLVAILLCTMASFAQKKPKATPTPALPPIDSAHSIIQPKPDSVYYVGYLTPAQLNLFIKFCLDDVDYLSDKGRKQWLQGFLQAFKTVPIPRRPTPPTLPTPKDTTSKK